MTLLFGWLCCNAHFNAHRFPPASYSLPWQANVYIYWVVTDILAVLPLVSWSTNMVFGVVSFEWSWLFSAGMFSFTFSLYIYLSIFHFLSYPCSISLLPSLYISIYLSPLPPTYPSSFPFSVSIYIYTASIFSHFQTIYFQIPWGKL